MIVCVTRTVTRVLVEEVVVDIDDIEWLSTSDGLDWLDDPANWLERHEHPGDVVAAGEWSADEIEVDA